MEKKKACVIVLLFCVLHLEAQTFLLQGRVTDNDMNPIELATVSVLAQGKVSMTNLHGEFSMELISSDSIIVKFSMVGYKTKTRLLKNPRGKQTLLIQLTDNNILDEVVVTEEKRQTDFTQQLDPNDIKQMPSASSNTVEELVKQQAGVSSHNELSAQYNVRGGSFDENSVYINGIEIYRPFLIRSGQQEGLSVINPNMVEKIEFSTGGFGAKYGDKMSSALSIQYGHPQKSKASLLGSLHGGNLYVALANKKVSWSNSIRYKTNRYLLNSLETKGEYRPNFLNYQTYFTYVPNRRWNIEFIGDISDNHYNFVPSDRETRFGTLENVKSFKVYFDGQEKDIFRTFMGATSITRNLNEKTQIKFVSHVFNTYEQEKYDIQGQYWLTQTETSENLGVGTYFEHARNYLKAQVASFQMMIAHHSQHHQLQFAATYKIEHVHENSIEYEMRDSSGYNIPHTGTDLKMIYALNAHNELNASRLEIYAQDIFKFSNSSKNTFYTLNYGVRFSHWNFNRESLLSPRVSFAIIPAFNHDTTIRFAMGVYYQAPFFKELKDTTTIDGITTVKLNNKIKSPRSIHLIAAYDYRFRLMNRPFKLSAEAYCKLLHNIIPYNVNNIKIVYDPSQQYKGLAAGLDLKLYGEFVTGTDSWITFSFMKTKMNINDCIVPLPTDQRFATNLFFTDYFPGTTRWKMTLNLTYSSGLPFCAPHSSMDKGWYRASAYKRVDIGMSYCILNRQHKKNYLAKEIWLGADCLNLFGINNVNSYYWITDVTNQQYAVPNYLTGRQFNIKLIVDF